MVALLPAEPSVETALCADGGGAAAPPAAVVKLTARTRIRLEEAQAEVAAVAVDNMASFTRTCVAALLMVALRWQPMVAL